MTRRVREALDQVEDLGLRQSDAAGVVAEQVELHGRRRARLARDVTRRLPAGMRDLHPEVIAADGSRLRPRPQALPRLGRDRARLGRSMATLPGRSRSVRSTCTLPVSSSPAPPSLQVRYSVSCRACRAQQRDRRRLRSSRPCRADSDSTAPHGRRRAASRAGRSRGPAPCASLAPCGSRGRLRRGLAARLRFRCGLA